jgi:hypothetical protein
LIFGVRSSPLLSACARRSSSLSSVASPALFIVILSSDFFFSEGEWVWLVKVIGRGSYIIVPAYTISSLCLRFRVLAVSIC